MTQAEQARTNAENTLNALESSIIRDGAVFSYLATTYAANPQENDWLALLRQIKKISMARQINSDVAFAVPLNNAVVKYQRVEETQSQSVLIRTSPLPIGYYYFWIERNGEIVSEKRLVPIVSQRESVVISERIK